MIIVALGLMMDNADPGRYFRDPASARSRERVVWKRNLIRSDYHKRHSNRAFWAHLNLPNRYRVIDQSTPLRAA